MYGPRLLAALIVGALGSGVLAATDTVQVASAPKIAAAPLPNVLIIGDSISMGYMASVAEALKGQAIVAHNTDPRNGGSTGRGVLNIDKWLGSNRWDVIHFNWGIWDITRSDRRNGEPMTPPEEYEARLDKLVTRLRQTNAKLIWASTTCCTNVPMRRNGDDVTYNAIAARIMMKHDVPIDDLHALTSTFTPELFMSPGNVHYSKEGYRKIGQQVAEAIEKALKD